MHGEVALIPWNYAIVKDTPDEVAVKFWTRPLRMPLLIEKIVSIKKNSTQLNISEQLTNESATHLDIMWGHHIAFGLPFLNEGAHIETNAKTMEVHNEIPAPRRFKSGKTYQWPHVEDASGKMMDASIIPDTAAPAYSDLAFLTNFKTNNNKAFYSITNPKQKVGFKVEWDASVFKCLWLCYTVALEPWTSKFTNAPNEAINNGEWLHLSAGEVVTTSLTAGAFEKV